MNISLTPQLSKYVNKRVASGQYTSASELVRESLRLMQKQDAAKDWLRREVMKGVRSAQRGPLIDGEAFFSKLLRDQGASRRRRKAG